MTTKKTLRLVLGVSFAALFLWLIFRQISIEEIKQAFAGASIIWVVAATAAFLVGYSCRIERWRLMLQSDNPDIKWLTCAGPLYASFAANNVLPFRAGDVIRCFAFVGKLGASSGVIVATLFFERLLDLLMMLVLLGIALIIFGVDTNQFTGVGGVVLINSAAAILLVLIFPKFFSPLALAIGRLIAWVAPNLGKRLLVEINKSLTTLEHLANGSTMIKLIFWSLLAWLAEGCVFWFAAFALPVIASPLASWIALPVGTLSTLIPSTPGYLGTFDYFVVRAMTEVGNAQGAAIAYAFLVHLLLWLPPTLIGGIYLLLYPIKQQPNIASFKV